MVSDLTITNEWAKVTTSTMTNSYWVFSYCLFASNSLYCVGWGIKLCSIQSSRPSPCHL